MPPILLVAVLDSLHLGASVERRFGRDLGERRHRDRKVALQALDRADERFRQNIQPMRQPSCRNISRTS